MVLMKINILFFNQPGTKAALLGFFVTLGLFVPSPAFAVDQSPWQDNAFLKAIYFNRSNTERVYIIGGTTVAISFMAYVLYKALTRTDAERNLIALDNIESSVKRQYWYRVKTEEIEFAAPMPSFKLVLDSFAKNIENVTLLSSLEKEELRAHVITVGNAIHNPRMSREQVAKACEGTFFGFIKQLRDQILMQQEEIEIERNKLKNADKGGSKKNK